MADPTHVGGFSYASASSETTTAAPALPAGIQAGDVGVMQFIYHPTTAVVSVPAGWTALGTPTPMGSASTVLAVRQMDGTESGTSVQLSSAVAQKLGFDVEVYRGAVLPTLAHTAAYGAPATTTTHPAPTVTAPAAGAATLSLYQRRASGEILSVAQPSGLTLIRAYADGAGGGNTTAAAAHSLTVSAGGATIGGGNWVIDPAEWGTIFTVALEPTAATSDTTAPSVPANLRTTSVGATSADLAWDASTDNVGVTGYEVIVTGPL